MPAAGFNAPSPVGRKLIRRVTQPPRSGVDCVLPNLTLASVHGRQNDPTPVHGFVRARFCPMSDPHAQTCKRRGSLRALRRPRLRGSTRSDCASVVTRTSRLMRVILLPTLSEREWDLALVGQRLSLSRESRVSQLRPASAVGKRRTSRQLQPPSQSPMR